MKTITIFLAASFLLIISSVFGNNEGVPARSYKETILNSVYFSAPVTPKEATFEDLIPASDLNLLAPVTPKEASFDDQDDEIILTGLAPVIPAEADFDEGDSVQSLDLKALAPVTPPEADFSELH
jgi:hypothetical protein